MEYMNRKELKQYLYDLGTGKRTPLQREFGICEELRWKTSKFLYGHIKTLMEDWPEYSGVSNYPVPHPSCPPKAAYYGFDDLWDDSSYGQARRRLCIWLSEQL